MRIRRAFPPAESKPNPTPSTTYLRLIEYVQVNPSAFSKASLVLPNCLFFLSRRRQGPVNIYGALGCSPLKLVSVRNPVERTGLTGETRRAGCSPLIEVRLPSTRTVITTVGGSYPMPVLL